jgi:hypothetical protein
MYATNFSNLHLIATTNALYSSPEIGTVNEVWTTRTSPFASGAMRGLTHVNGVWYAVGNNMGYGGIYTSPDGITWTSRISLSLGQTFGAVYGRYNGGLSRYEISAYPSDANSNIYSSITNGTTWTTHAVGWSPQTLVHGSFNQTTYFANNYVTGPYYLSYHYPGPYAPTALTNPFGSSYVTAIGGASVMSTYETLVASLDNQLAVSLGFPASTWTLIERPPLAGNEFIRSITSKNGPALGQTTYIVTTSATRVFNATVTLGASNRAWTDISPPPITNRAVQGSVYNYLQINTANTIYLGSPFGGILRTQII